MPKHITIVEDELAIAQNYKDAFVRQGFEVSLYARVDQALAALKVRLPDLVLVDVGLGDDPEGGFELCRQLRALSATLPIIFLTARDSELDRVLGLRLGADDYLTKDISQAHLMARVIALFRRVDAFRQSSVAGHQLERGPLSLDPDTMQVSWHQQLLDLTVTEFWIVQALASHPGHVKNRQQLMDAAQVVLDDNTITSHIKRIRRKFKALDENFDCIQTAYGLGYRWVNPACAAN